MEANIELLEKNKINGIICDQEIKILQDNVVICDSNKIKFTKKTVIEEIGYYKSFFKNRINNNRILKNMKKLKIEDIINRKIINLTESEKYKFYFSLISSIDSEIYIYADITKYLDINGKKLIKSFLNDIKQKKKVAIIDKEIDNIFNIADNYIYIKNNLVINYGKNNNYYEDIETLMNNNLTPPVIHMITYLVKKEKKIKLFYHNDSRDIIKDIYKHI